MRMDFARLGVRQELFCVKSEGSVTMSGRSNHVDGLTFNQGHKSWFGRVRRT